MRPGTGAARATIKFTTATTARLYVTGDKNVYQNITFLVSIDAVSQAMWVQADDFRMSDCDFIDDTSCQAVLMLMLYNANRAIVERIRILGDTAAGGTYAIRIVGGTLIEIRNFRITGNYSTGAIQVATTATTRLWIHDGLIKTYNSADICIIDTITGSTGQMGPNLWLDLTDNAANITEAITGATFRVFDPIYVVNADNEKGLLINWTASADA